MDRARPPQTEIVSNLPDKARALLRQALLAAMVTFSVPAESLAYAPDEKAHAAHTMVQKEKREAREMMKKEGVRPARILPKIFNMTNNEQLDIEFKDPNHQLQEFLNAKQFGDEFCAIFNAYQAQLGEVLNSSSVTPSNTVEYETDFERARLAQKTLRPLFQIMNSIIEMHRVIIAPQQSQPHSPPQIQTRFKDVPVMKIDLIASDLRLRSQMRQFMSAMEEFLKSSPQAQHAALDFDNKQWKEEGETFEQLKKPFSKIYAEEPSITDTI